MRFLLLSILMLLCACASSHPKKYAPKTKEEKVGIAYYDEGTDKLINQDYTEALRNLTEASKYLSKNTDVWNNLGLAYMGKEQKEKAVECWKRALDIDSNYTDAHSNLGTFYYLQHNYAEAEAELKIVIKDLVYEKVNEAYYTLGLLYLAQRHTLKAEEYFRLAVQSKDNYCPAWLQLALLQKERNAQLDALSSFKNSTSGICYENPQAHFEMGNIYIKEKNIPQAKAKYMEVIEHFPQSEWARKAEVNLNLIQRE